MLLIGLKNIPQNTCHKLVRGDYIRAQPSSFPINTSTRVQFSYQFPSIPNESKPVVELQRLDGNTGAVIGSEGFMQDNGQLSLGDDIRGDAVFSFRKTYNFSAETTIWLRAKVTVGGKTYFSEPLRVMGYDPQTPSAEQLQEMRSALNEAETIYQKLLPIKGYALAHDEAVAYLNSLDIVAEATSKYNDGSNGEPLNYGISVRFIFGIGADISTAPRGTRGGSKYDLKINESTTKSLDSYLKQSKSGFVSQGINDLNSSNISSLELAKSSSTDESRVNSNKVLVLSPFEFEFGSNNFNNQIVDHDKGREIANIFQSKKKANGSSKFDVSYYENSNADIELFKQLDKYGVVHIATHGDITEENYLGQKRLLTVISTGTPSNDANISRYIGDLKTDRVRIFRIDGKEYFSITGGFIVEYLGSMPNSLVYLSGCRVLIDSLNLDFYYALQGKGAKSVIGYNYWVAVRDADFQAKAFHSDWSTGQTALDSFDSIQDGLAFNRVDFNSIPGQKSPPETFVYQETNLSPVVAEHCLDGKDIKTRRQEGFYCYRLLGDRDLKAYQDEIIQNGGFENGAIASWNIQGDARIIGELPPYLPTEGSSMAIISTGLGQETESATVSQSFSIPQSGLSSLSFDWNFNSEEFREFCGSRFQDFFKVELVSESGQTLTIFSTTIDQLCNDTVSVPISFDQGDVWSTGWQTKTFNISNFASQNLNKTATIRFSVGDVGDSIYDTAVLLDCVEIS